MSEKHHLGRCARLGDVCELNPRRPILSREDASPTTFIPMSAVAENGRGIVQSEVRPFAEIRRGYTYLAERDVLFAKITPCMQNGKHAVATGLIDGIGFASTEFHVIRPQANVLPEWVHLFLVQPKILQDATAHFSGSVGQQRVPESYLSSLTIPIPSVDEQHRIVAAVHKQIAQIDHAHVAAGVQLEAANALPAAYLREVFESSEAQAWPLEPIGSLAKVQSGYAFKSEWFSGTGIRLLRNANLHQGYIDWGDQVYLPIERRSEFESYELRNGDIVLSLDRPLVAAGLKVARLGPADTPALLLQRVARFIVTTKVNSEFLYAFLNTRRFIKSITGHDQSIGVPHVSPGQVEAVKVPLPPLDRQQQIVGELTRVLQRAASLRSLATDMRETLEAVPPALLRQAFNGVL